MTDYIAKARKGRVIALQMRQSGTEMFFPEETIEDVTPLRRTVHAMGKPMFVRSSTFDKAVVTTAPAPETVANGPLVLSEDQLVARIMKEAA